MNASSRSRRGQLIGPGDVSSLKGRLVILTGVRVEDVDDFVRFLADPEVSRHTNPPPRTPAEVLAWIDNARRKRVEGLTATFAVRLSSSMELVGVAQVGKSTETESVDWGWSLAPKVWGTGVFSDVTTLLKEFAKTEFGAAELLARVSAANLRAEHALRKQGARFLEDRGGVRIWATSTDSRNQEVRRTGLPRGDVH